MSCVKYYQVSAGHTNRPMSPLVTSIDQENNNIKPVTAAGDENTDNLKNIEESEGSRDGSLTPRKSPEVGEFRARAASAGQQARAHAMQVNTNI